MKTKRKSIRDEYPDHPADHGERAVGRRGGCKVYWESFATRAEAERASKWAIVEGEIRERQGYDSGYCSAGSITENKAGGFKENTPGTFEVCFL